MAAKKQPHAPQPLNHWQIVINDQGQMVDVEARTMTLDEGVLIFQDDHHNIVRVFNESGWFMCERLGPPQVEEATP